MAHKNWNSLERDIVNKVQLSTLDAQRQAVDRLHEYMGVRFYATEKPKRYKRTGHLGESGMMGDYIQTKDGATGALYIDDSDFYTTGTYPTPIVFQEAEVHGSGIIGNPYFWWDTMMDIESEIIPNAFGKYFKKI